MKQKFSNIPVFCTVGLAAVGGFSVGSVKDEVSPKVKTAGLDAHETHAAASMLGQFRTTTSGWLWVRTDLYLHNGVQMRPLSDRELEEGRTGVGSADNHEGSLHDDSKHVTVIPSPDRDFRGIFGDLERATKTYKDMTGHTHNNPRQSLPLFRLMTWLDPEFIPGWTTGSAVLCFEHKQEGYKMAVDFLKEGIKHNPQSIAIYNQLGYVQLTRLHDYTNALKAFEKARSLGNTVNPKLLSEDDQEGLNMTYRWLYLVYRNRGDLATMYDVLREGHAKFKDDGILERALNAPPLIRRDKTDTTDVATDIRRRADEAAEFH